MSPIHFGSPNQSGILTTFDRAMSSHAQHVEKVNQQVTEFDARVRQKASSDPQFLQRLQTLPSYQSQSPSVLEADCRTLVTESHQFLKTLNAKINHLLSPPAPSFHTNQQYRSYRSFFQGRLQAVVKQSKNSYPPSSDHSVQTLHGMQANTHNAIRQVSQEYAQALKTAGLNDVQKEQFALLAASACEDIIMGYRSELNDHKASITSARAAHAEQGDRASMPADQVPTASLKKAPPTSSQAASADNQSHSQESESRSSDSLSSGDSRRDADSIGHKQVSWSDQFINIEQDVEVGHAAGQNEMDTDSVEDKKMPAIPEDHELIILDHEYDALLGMDDMAGGVYDLEEPAAPASTAAKLEEWAGV